jgi:5-methylcytosine-specific restriction protein B
MLQNIFENKILPLLEEYFFEDWEKIRLVLGDNQKNNDHQFIIKESYGIENLFGKVEDNDFEKDLLYRRNPTAFKKENSYIQIYES